jgi:4-diphosphocytidyl-2-C-methyl-D-erythritol kinase
MQRPDIATAVRSATETAYAKINLALHVRGRRADGYHALESLFAFAEDGDLLRAEVNDSGVIDLTIDGPFADGLSVGADNLVMRAAEGLQALTGGAAGAHIHLDKRLPVASGIGGGSADAAAALRLLMRLWDVALSPEALHELALSLGSDVPACVVSQTQFVGGRGEELSQADVERLDGAPLLLVNPRTPLATGPVFAGWDQVDRGALVANSVAGLARDGRNDLEAPAMKLVPQIAEILGALQAQPGVLLSRMSGSGATCFALFDSVAARDEAQRRMNPAWWTMASRIRAA